MNFQITLWINLRLNLSVKSDTTIPLHYCVKALVMIVCLDEELNITLSLRAL